MRLYYDLHIHSCLSPCGDADMTPCNIVNMAALKGLNCIAVSDHNCAGNARACVEAAKELPLLVLPAVEAESAEEAHLLCVFPEIDGAEDMGKLLLGGLTVPNRPEIFGEQVYRDQEDAVLGVEEKLLVTATPFSIDRIKAEAEERGGVCIPAHVDRSSYSVLSNLGFLPSELAFSAVEFSKNCAVEAFAAAHPDLHGPLWIQNSDAHYLGDIAEAVHFLEVEENSSEAVIKLLEGKV